MTRGKPPSGTESNDHFLARWSRRKHAAARGRTLESGAPPAPAAAAETSAAPVVPAAEAAPAPLPPLESLTPESDFSPFMRAEVDEGVKREALKTLFQDPRFNVMDGLDVYIDDFSKPDPLPEGWLEKMNQVTRLGDYRPPEEAPEAPAEAAETADSAAPERPPAEAPEVPSADTASGTNGQSEVPES